MMNDLKFRKHWGRKKGRPLRETRQQAMDSVLDRQGISIDAIEKAESHSVHPAQWFQSTKEIWLEIGFGNGEHVVGIAKNNPDIGVIGCEPYINGISALCKMIEADGSLENIRIWPEDAHVFIDRLAADSIDRCFVLFPDPWPKARHHKRRIIRRENLDVLSRLIKKDGILELATDDTGLAEWMLEEGLAHPDFEWLAQSAADWRSEPEDWVKTRYQEKALEQGRKPYFIRFRRL